MIVASGTINPAYKEWEVQDQILLSWLQSTLSKTILSHVLRAIHSYQVWEHIHDHFFTQTKAHARHLRTDLCAQSLENKTKQELLGQVKSIAKEHAGIDCPVKNGG